MKKRRYIFNDVDVANVTNDVDVANVEVQQQVLFTTSAT